MGTQVKKQRALPITDIYKIHSFQYVSIVDGYGTYCQNCGKLISNIVTIENQRGEKFTVGNDCASTLTIDKSKIVLEIEPAFNEGKDLRAKMTKLLNNKRITKAYIYTGNDNKKYLILNYVKGGSSMIKIAYPNITLPYINNLLNFK